jgi:hypothetical protein
MSNERPFPKPKSLKRALIYQQCSVLEDDLLLYKTGVYVEVVMLENVLWMQSFQMGLEGGYINWWAVNCERGGS